MQIELPLQQPKNVAVREMTIFLTEDCNLRCEYCFVAKRPRTMSAETARKVVEFCLTRSILGMQRTLQVNFFGGEPFLAHERMAQIIELFSQPRPNLSVRCHYGATTNATIATSAVERLIRDHQIHLFVSLDGSADANQARPFVSGRPSHNVVLQNIPKFVSWSPRVDLRMTFHPQALDLVANLKAGFEHLPAGDIYLCPVVEADWTGYESRVEDAHLQMAQWFLEEFRAGRPPRLPITWSYLRVHDRFHRLGDTSLPQRPCEIGHEWLAVNYSGNVMPCFRYLDRPEDWLGSVEDEQGVCSQRQPYLHLSTAQVGRCPDCPSHQCGGGCRVLSLRAGAGFFGHHPNHCLLLKAHLKAVEIIYNTLLQESPTAFLSCLQNAGPPNFLNPN